MLGSRPGSRSRSERLRDRDRRKGREPPCTHPHFTYTHNSIQIQIHFPLLHLHGKSTQVHLHRTLPWPRHSQEVSVDGAALCRESMRSQLHQLCFLSTTMLTDNCIHTNCKAANCCGRDSLLPVSACEGCRSPFRPEPYGKTPQAFSCRCI